MTLDLKQLSNKVKRDAVITPNLNVSLDFAMLNGETALPSKAKFYKTKIVYVRGLRYKEQLEISQIDNIQDPETAYYSLLRVYKNCIEIEGVDFEGMLEEDFTTLSFWIVFLTNAEQKYQLIYKCKKCEAENNQEISPAQIDLYDFELFEPQNIETDLGLLQLAPLTMKENMWGKQIDRANQINNALILGRHIKRKDGEPLDTLEQRMELFGALSPKDVKAIHEVVLKFKSGMKPIECVCSKCKNKQGIIPNIDLLKGLP